MRIVRQNWGLVYGSNYDWANDIVNPGRRFVLFYRRLTEPRELPSRWGRTIVVIVQPSWMDALRVSIT